MYLDKNWQVLTEQHLASVFPLYLIQQILYLVVCFVLNTVLGTAAMSRQMSLTYSLYVSESESEVLVVSDFYTPWDCSSARLRALGSQEFSGGRLRDG